MDLLSLKSEANLLAFGTVASKRNVGVEDGDVEGMSFLRLLLGQLGVFC